ncbi:hypothetical protein PCE1_000383 [Barthelona sp. PCE]
MNIEEFQRAVNVAVGYTFRQKAPHCALNNQDLEFDVLPGFETMCNYVTHVLEWGNVDGTRTGVMVRRKFARLFNSKCTAPFKPELKNQLSDSYIDIWLGLLYDGVQLLQLEDLTTDEQESFVLIANALKDSVVVLGPTDSPKEQLKPPIPETSNHSISLSPTVKKRGSNVDSDIALLTAQMQQLRFENEELNRRLGSTMSKQDNKFAENGLNELKMNNMTAELTYVRDQLKKMEESRDKAEAERINTLNDLNSALEKVNRLQSVVDDAKSVQTVQRTQMNQDERLQIARLEKYEKERIALNGTVKQCRINNEQMEHRIALLEQDLREQRQNNSMLETKALQQEESIQRLLDIKKGYEAQQLEVDHVSNDVAIQLKNAQLEIKVLNSQLNDAKLKNTDLQVYKKQYDELEQQVNVLNRDIGMARNAKELAEMQLRNLQQNMEQLMKEAELSKTLKHQNSQMHSELQTAKESLRNSRFMLQTKNDTTKELELEAKLESTTKKAEDYKMRLNLAVKEGRNIEKEYHKLKKETRKLKDIVQKKNEQLEKTFNECQQHNMQRNSTLSEHLKRQETAKLRASLEEAVTKLEWAEDNSKNEELILFSLLHGVGETFITQYLQDQ